MNEPVTYSIGEWIKRRRGALHLTQRELAEKAYCSLITIKKIEADERRPSADLAGTLIAPLKIRPNEQETFIQCARGLLPVDHLSPPDFLEPEAPPLPAEGIRGYEIRQRLGAGSYGAVYRAYQRAVHRDVAIKTILPRLANQPDFIRRFEFEARLVARLEHPNIVPLYDYWRDPSGAYLVMRWLRGGSLQAAIDRGPLNLQTSADLVEQITSALQFAHEQNVVHRDIKPANILLDEANHAYVSDFGIGFLVDYPGLPNAQENGDQYVLSSPVEYSSPEQLRGAPPSNLSDIYNLGLVLHEMITGRHPFMDLPPKEIRRRQLIEPLPSIHEQRPDVPPAVDEVIQKATNKDPALRFQNALDFGAAYALAVTGETELLPGISTTSRASAVNPYKGLRSFTESDADDFFGREKLVQSLLTRLAVNENGGILAVVGPSGSGKSSVVHAGLIPALRSGALPGSEKWFFIKMHPGRHPFEELEAALLRVAVNPPDSLLGQLREDGRGLHRALLRCLPDENGRLFLFIDQFEELFTLVVEEEIRQKFLDVLVEAISDPASRLHVVYTLRADFYDRPLLYPRFGRLVRDHAETVLPLSAAEFEQAIVQPAQESGAHFEEGLAVRIIDEVLHQPGALPLLQYALTELYDSRDDQALTHDAYNKTGGVTRALAQRAETLYRAQDPEEQEALRQVFLRLVAIEDGQAGSGGGMRRRESLESLLGLYPDDDRLRETLDAFARARLLTLDSDPQSRAPMVEVAHEALIEEWQQLRDWLAESKDDLFQQQRLNNLATEWLAGNHDPGLLLREKRLDQLAAWAQNSSLTLTPEEQEYLVLSLEARQVRQAEEEARRQQELDNARQLAETEKKRAEEQSAAAQRLRRRALFLVGVLTIAAILAVVAVFNGRRAGQNAREAQDNLALAVTREAEAVANANAAATQEALAEQNAELAAAREAEAQNVALVAGSQAALANYAMDSALALAWQAVKLHPESALAQAQLSEAAYAPGTVRIFTGNDAVVNRVAISPDDKTVLAGTVDGNLILWELATGEILWEQQAYPAEVNDIAFTPDGQQVAATFDDRIMFWEAADGRLIREIESSALDQKIAFNPSGEQFVTIGKEEESRLILWDYTSGEPLREFERGSEIEDIVYTADGSTLLLASKTGTLMKLDARSGEVIYETQANLGIGAGALRFIKINPDGTQVLGSFGDSGLVTWDLASGEMLQFLRNQGGALALAYLPQEEAVLIGGQGLRTIDPETGEVLHANNSQGDAIFDISATSDGRYAVGTSLDGTVRMWDTQGGQVVHKFSGPKALLFEIALSPNARSVLVGLTDGTATLYDVETGDVIQRLVDDQPIMSVTFSADGRRALTGGGYRLAEKIESGHIILWDLETGEEIRRFEGHPYAVFDVEFSPGEQMIASAGNGAVAILWDTETGEEIRRFEDYWVDNLYPDISFWDIEFSPDGDQLFAAHADGTIIAWDVDSGEEIQQLLGRNSGGKITFSSDGRRLVSGSVGSEVILWETDTGDIVRQFSNNSGAVGYVKFSPDETLLLGGGENGTNSLWQVETGEEIRRYGGGFGFSPNFSPDGRQAVIGFRDGAVELWRIDSTLDELLSWTQNNRYIPDLTCEQRELYSIEPLCDTNE